MKKLIIIILICGIVFCFMVGCSNNKKEIEELKQQIEDLRENTANPTPAPTIVSTSSPTVLPTPAPTVAPTPSPTVAPTPSPTIAPTPVPTVAPTPAPTVAPTPAPTVVPSPVPTPNTENLSIARWEDDVFISDWAGFRIPLPNGWYKATDEEILAVYSVGLEIFAGVTDQSIEDFEDISYVYPMLIMKYPLGSLLPGINTNICVFYERLNPPNDILVGPDIYLDIVKGQYESMDIGYEPLGEITSISVNGETYSSITFNNTDYGMQQVLLCRKFEKYIIGIIITGSINNRNEIDNLINSIERN